MPRAIVTTSWDDGARTDLRLADLLSAYGIPGTFYVPIHAYVEPLLSPAEIVTLHGGGFEIGAHAVIHKNLANVRDPGSLRREIRDSKLELQDITASEVKMFCYPGGYYSKAVLQHVRECGYLGGRTARMLSTGSSFDRFETPVTMQAYPHSRYEYAGNVFHHPHLESVHTFLREYSVLPCWSLLGKRTFDHVLQHGGVWHLFGHSWEIDQFELWQELEHLLDYIGRRQEVLYLTNSEVIEYLTEAGKLAHEPEIVRV